MFFNRITDILQTITKVRNFTVFIVFVVFLLVSSPTEAFSQQKYSIDKEKIKKRKQWKIFSVKTWFKKDERKAVQRQLRKDDKKRTKALRTEQKALKEYQKKANSNREVGKDRKVYKRMRKFEKQAERRRKNKPSKNFFERLFSKSKHHKKSKKRKS